MQTHILEVFAGADNGLASTVAARPDGRYAVTLLDTDAGAALDVVQVFDQLQPALAAAQRMVQA